MKAVFFPVFLNVSNIQTYDIAHDKFCIKWTAHRAATSYRIRLNPLDREWTFSATLFASYVNAPRASACALLPTPPQMFLETGGRCLEARLQRMSSSAGCGAPMWGRAPSVRFGHAAGVGLD